MTIKLGNIADWRVLEGKSLSFVAPDYDAKKPRRVVLYVNSEAACNWYIQSAEGERFLAALPAGLETLDFVCNGDFDLMPNRAEGVEIQYWTSEAEEYWTEGDGETFSTIYERQPRNEALEYVMFQASQNQLRRDKAHAEELAAIRAEIGAMNAGQSGIHGGSAAQHQEPGASGSGGAQGAGAVPGAGVGSGADGKDGAQGADGTPKGENP